MLSATGLNLSFGPQAVLRDVNLTVDAGTRAGLVGANGSGKTSLLTILAGEAVPDSGAVTRARSARLAYLPQRLPVASGLTVEQLADQGFQHEHDLFDERQRNAEYLVTNPEDTAAITRVAEIDEELERVAYHARQAEVGRVLQGLGFEPDDLSRPLLEFSGGWQMRASLARTLLSRPDILLLDEPTNYLDSEARLWLADILSGHPGAVILVSHDRAFLDDTVSVILELHSGQLTRYPGTYSVYERRRAAELDQLLQQWKQQQREIQRQEDFVRRFRAKASKARQVQSRVKALEKQELIEIPAHLRPVSIRTPEPPHSGRRMVEIEELSHSYQVEPVLKELSLSIERGQRVAVVGRNGAGKSTLLRILAGQMTARVGTVRWGSGVRIAYFAQDAAESLPAGETVLSYLAGAAGPDAPARLIRSVLGSFLFDDDALEKPLEVLSGGERSRLIMAGLLVRPVNLLILDEPTNHLDMASQQVLARALQDYGGSLITVSHDREFLRSVASDVLALWKPAEHSGDSWRLYPGSFHDFETSHLGEVFFSDGHAPPSGRSTAEGARRTGGDSVTEAAPEGSSDYRMQKERRGELRRLQRRETELLQEIEGLEQQLARLDTEMAREENYADGAKIRELQRQRDEAEGSLNARTAEWEAVASRLGESPEM